MFRFTTFQNHSALYDTEIRKVAILPSEYRLVESAQHEIVDAIGNDGRSVEFHWQDPAQEPARAEISPFA